MRSGRAARSALESQAAGDSELVSRGLVSLRADMEVELEAVLDLPPPGGSSGLPRLHAFGVVAAGHVCERLTAVHVNCVLGSICPASFHL